MKLCDSCGVLKSNSHFSFQATSCKRCAADQQSKAVVQANAGSKCMSVESGWGFVVTFEPDQKLFVIEQHNDNGRDADNVTLTAAESKALAVWILNQQEAV